jgi:hypothetical protein
MRVEPNKFEVCKDQISKYQGIEVPSEINESEAHLFHVLIIKSKANSHTLQFENVARVQKFHKEVFEKNADKGGFNRLGYDNVFVFHDPTLKPTRKTTKKNVVENDEVTN